MTRGWSPVLVLLHLIAVLAVAGVVHIVTLLQAPARATHDAFLRIAAPMPLNRMAHLEPMSIGPEAVPFRDPAMVSGICRFDLSSGPLRITIDPLDNGFLAIGLHSRRGLAFYGLNVGADARSVLRLLVLTADQQTTERPEADDEGSIRDIRIVAPEAEGFVLVDTPAGEGGATAAALSRLDRFHCESANAAIGPRP